MAFIKPSFAFDDHCSYFKYCGSSGGSQSSAKSHPTTSISSAFNPSNISKITGIGLETIIQPSNPLGFNLASGTGKFGGALISPTLENGFFGNRSIEIEDVYLQRVIDSKRYKSNKLNIALGTNLVQKNNFSLDIGISLKRNNKIKKINPGIGISSSVSIFNFGFAYYQDDTYVELGNYINPRTNVPYSVEFNSTKYQEKFSVKTFSIGTKIGNFAIDGGRIMTSYKFYNNIESTIDILSTAYNRGNFLYNLAYRKETTPNLKVVNNTLALVPDASDIYFGVQYMVNKHLLIGVGYNTFLLKELSATVTLYL
jgi:hypothetical protein